MPKQKKLPYQPLWDAVRKANPQEDHKWVDREASSLYAKVKYGQTLKVFPNMNLL